MKKHKLSVKEIDKFAKKVDCEKTLEDLEIIENYPNTVKLVVESKGE